MSTPPDPPGAPQPPEWPAPQQPPTAYPGPPPNAPGAVSSLVLGIIGVTLCPICGPIALIQGRKAEQAARQPGFSGEGMAKAGWILGIIGSVFLGLWLLYLVVVVIVGASSV